MAEPATRVALLARPGAACDNLQAALRQAGAEVVAIQDPGDGDPAAIAAAHPAAVLVALEPAIEGALERYDDVLSQPGRLVIYDEVAVAARREGWEAARWARHLAAKFGGHGDVLPPGAGNDDDAPQRPRAAAAAPVRAVAPEPSAAPAAEPRPDAPPPAPEPPRGREPAAAATPAFDADSVHLGVEPAHEEALAKAGEGIDFGGFTPEMLAAMGMEPLEEPPAAAREAPAAPQEGLATNDAGADEGRPAGNPAPADEGVLEWEAPPAAAPRPEPAAAPQAERGSDAPAPIRLRADEMELVDIEPVVQSGGKGAFRAEGGDRGGVVVFAGIGGPDAVRQFLGGLPGGFSRPIIVRQRLDGGRHDRLVRQMQRATALPVELAEPGKRLVDGHVYILPDGLLAEVDGTAASFAPATGEVPLLAGFPAGDSALLLLSGSDPAIVPEAMQAASAGALVVGQSPEDSFDGAAAAALVAAGGESRPAAELAQRLSTRWLSLKD